MNEKIKHIYIGSDHAGFTAKDQLKDYLTELGYEFIDLGCFNEEPCDYPDSAREVGEKVSTVPDSIGIIICGTGVGVSMAANKVQGIRAVLGANEHLAEMSRQHNNANVLALGARENDIETLKKIVDKFLDTNFEAEERHVRRVNKIDTI